MVILASPPPTPNRLFSLPLSLSLSLSLSGMFAIRVECEYVESEDFIKFKAVRNVSDSKKFET